MQSICAGVLRLQHYDSRLRLREVIINLGLSNGSMMTTPETHSTQCSSTCVGFLKLKADTEEQGEALAAHMKSPKIIRILAHSIPQLEIRSLDILTGKCMVLADGMAGRR